MVKRCSYGTCNADSRYPERLGNIQFHPFPKPATNLEKCMKWIRLCGWPHQQLSLDKLRNHSTAKHIYVCSKHFVDGRPTPAHPDPLPALTYDRSNVTPVRHPPKLRTVSVPPRKRRVDSMPDNAENSRVRCDLQGVSMDITGEMATESLMEDTTTEETTIFTEIGMCFFFFFFECTDDQPQMGEIQEELKRMKALLAQKEKEKENDLLREKMQTGQAPYPLTPETINNSSVPNYFGYCNGDIITENMPENYKAEFPTTFAILDCTELKIEKPSSLLQSQTYSNYKSTNTHKSLIACDPRGSIMFTSTLYTGSISDQELFRQ
ncbi:uncharacterized protein LOC125271507 [Megalobrama amblycephala]|uniref:uncharacterized protein LOC125271507 n=1 Tax=Megalobrama amblycephala TaxID=75352 RepID=UPI0020141A2A|nr:uncharacterized protein LOC125271507 [Megalobrama amblycephala]